MTSFEKWRIEAGYVNELQVSVTQEDLCQYMFNVGGNYAV